MIRAPVQGVCTLDRLFISTFIPRLFWHEVLWIRWTRCQHWFRCGPPCRNSPFFSRRPCSLSTSEEFRTGASQGKPGPWPPPWPAVLYLNRFMGPVDDYVTTKPTTPKSKVYRSINVSLACYLLSRYNRIRCVFFFKCTLCTSFLVGKFWKQAGTKRNLRICQLNKTHTHYRGKRDLL